MSEESSKVTLRVDVSMPPAAPERDESTLIAGEQQLSLPVKTPKRVATKCVTASRLQLGADRNTPPVSLAEATSSPSVAPKLKRNSANNSAINNITWTTAASREATAEMRSRH
eukprot:4409292-Prymnesium_polylepis.1